MSRTAQPVLTAGRLRMRPWGPVDVQALQAAYSEPDIQQWHARSMTTSEALKWIKSRSERWARECGADWAITDDSGVLGRIGLKRIELVELLAEVSYWVLPRARGCRVAATALSALADWLFVESGCTGSS